MIRKIILGLLLNALAFFTVVQLVPQVNVTGGLSTILICGIILGIINGFVKPIVKVFSFPLIFITGGLFLIVINAFALYITKEIIGVLEINGIALSISGITTYIKAGLIFGVVNWLEHWLIKN